ncbi:MAG: error-prone DNA polymerase [Hyphomicrobiaceae bacterium]
MLNETYTHLGSRVGYAELQVTSNFSFLHGGSHAHELVERAGQLGLDAIAVVDRNTLAGVVRAHTAARAAGLRVITGARLEFRDAPSLLCLPKDRAAYGRLSRLLSLGQARAEKGDCILYLEDVAAHAQGQIFIALAPDAWCWCEALAPIATKSSTSQVIAFPGVSQDTAEGDQADALKDRPDRSSPEDEPFERALYRICEAVAPAGLYLAATHLYRGDDRARIEALARIAERVGIELVATNDVLYHAPARRPLQDVLTCVREKTTINEAGLKLAANAERHLKSPGEMARLFCGYERAIANTLAISEACRFSLDELAYEYPDEPVPPGETPQSQLEKLAWEGAQWRFPNGVPEKVRYAISKELALIAELEYAPYFLTVHDIVQFARSRDILCQGRGSAANSAVCYCIAITSVDPSEVDLLFERFISSERKEPPDIDVDFEHERREEVIQYIYARYGRERAGLAATVISYRARSAVRDVGKAMGLSEDTVTALAGMVWGTRSGGVLPEKHVREAGLDPADPLLRAVLALTFELMGFPRHLSQHVGGFVLTRGPLTEVVPVGNAAMDDRTFIEWDKDDLQALGLLKIDVLALGMLSCIRRAFEFLEEHHGRRMTLANVPRKDAAVYDMLCKADSIGVFQVESRAQMNMLPRLKPRTYYDLVIEVAIVRPGPIQGDMVHPYLRRRDGLEAETYPSPASEHGPQDELRQILGKTKGVPLFQEQAMRIAMEAAKFDDAEVNELRQALATFRRRGTIHLLEEKMISRMVARGYEKQFAERCFNQIKGFGEYGFPESHAASFAHLVYISSWLKWHYPAAFCAAILNAQPMGFYAPAQLVRDAREHGVEVRPVDVNFSDWDATLEPGEKAGRPAVRLGLRQVDGLRRDEADKIVVARHAQQARITIDARPLDRHRLAFQTIDDLVHATQVMPNMQEVPSSQLSRAALERLAAADAFRSLGRDRREALWDTRGLGPTQELPLFSWAETSAVGPEDDVALPQMPLAEHVVNDYQTLRLSLKAHPVSFLRPRLIKQHAVSCADIRALPNGRRVAVVGAVLIRQRPGTAKGVVFMTIEDETGVANVVVWAKTMERYRKVIMTARLIEVRGVIQRHEDIIHIVSAHLVDRNDWLAELSDMEDAMPVPIAHADEVKRPDPGSARAPDHPRWAGHPRNERILPKSRDFH